MTDKNAFPATLLVQEEGVFTDLVEGTYTKTCVQATWKGVPMAWALWHHSRHALVHVHDGTTRRFFIVNPRLPFAYPYEHALAGMDQWFRDLTEASRDAGGRLSLERLRQNAARDGFKPPQADALARAARDEMDPITTGRLMKGRWVDSLTLEGEIPWEPVAGVAVLAFFQGWQLADLILPDTRQFPWLQTVVLLALVLIVFWMARRADS